MKARTLIALFAIVVMTRFLSTGLTAQAHSVQADESAITATANPVPVINQPLRPGAAKPGGAGFTLAVNGTGFAAGSVVIWNGSPRTTHFMSHSRLTATILIANNLSAEAQSFDKPPAAETAQAPAAVAPTSPTIDARDIKIDGRPIRGTQDAKVTIVFFDDFQCPYSAAMYKTLFDEVMKGYAGRVKVTLRDVPNAQIHPLAMHAAIDANCLAAQNVEAYWDFADYLHAHQTEITADRLDKLALERGQKHNLQVAPLQECIQAQSDAAIKPARSEAIHHLGVKAVPMLFINGENLEGALSAQRLREAIDRALRAVGESVPTRAPPASVVRPALQPVPGTAGPVQALKHAYSELMRPTGN